MALTRQTRTSLVRWLMGEALAAEPRFVRLSTVVPAADGTGWVEVAVGFGGYVPAGLAGLTSVPSNGLAQNNAVVSLGTPTTGGAVLSAWGVWTAATGGTLRYFEAIQPGLLVVAGREVRFDVGALRVQVL